VDRTSVNAFDKSLTRAEWQRLRAAYTARLRPWAEDRARRTARGIKHPVHDFLFEYYSFRPSHLMRWSPGLGVRLEGAKVDNMEWGRLFHEVEGGIALHGSTFPAHRVTYLDWAINYLRAVAAREPSFGCFGLHEWAMVYGSGEVRHAHVPLRLRPAEIDAVVETQGLRCTHYDAFRFFSPEAAPQNRQPLTRADTADHDQPGCVHANMDLYRFAYLIAPYVPGELLADTFELAAEVRALDMRASPYDLTGYGLTPVEIETRAGREEYVRIQRDLAEAAAGLRQDILAGHIRLRTSVGCGPEKQQPPTRVTGSGVV
jgi:hypothetical protein